MTPVIISLVGLTLLCTFNLAFTYGVIRRLREHGDLLATRTAPGTPVRPRIADGEPVGEFSALTNDGMVIDRGFLADRTLVAFFSTDCDFCHEQLPIFVDWAARQAGGSIGVLAVVEGPEEVAHRMAADLEPVAKVVTVTDSHAGITAAFQVKAWPSFLYVADGVVRGSALRAAELPSTVAA
ncbi:hypothetical protein [Nonomuraea sp. NPDC050643]|uniref:hypothetical protein n=1 Tax=Nonomuraea sp. NPDC050643 TaxID=3155660 RepID=UPI0033CEA89B